ncbi:MAG: hypothetical protein EXQ97_06590 [Alphaproteobacteria bacterium]|nr:hypothetical protein [Alphaproteobacteria bacterium]
MGPSSRWQGTGPGATNLPMTATVFNGVAARATLLPAALLPLRGPVEGRDAVFWPLVLVAVVGPVAFDLSVAWQAWPTGFSAALWITVGATTAAFALLAAMMPAARLLAPLLFPYLALLGLVGTIWLAVPARQLSGHAPPAGLALHIAASVATYALATLDAVSGLAVALQERAIRTRRPSRLARALPPVAEAERLAVILLWLAGAVLVVGLVSGVTTLWLAERHLLALDHETVLGIAALAVIGGLLAARRVSGLRGRRAARLVLLAFLLLTLAFPDVKFVTDVVMG